MPVKINRVWWNGVQGIVSADRRIKSGRAWNVEAKLSLQMADSMNLMVIVQDKNVTAFHVEKLRYFLISRENVSVN